MYQVKKKPFLMENQIKLINLPELVLECLLSYLDLESLLALRLVSKVTKSWIEQTQHLVRLQLTIETAEAFNSLSKNAIIPWSNFKFTWDSLPSKIQGKALFQFTSQFSESLRILDLSKCEMPSVHTHEWITTLLLNSHNLTSLKIFELSATQINKCGTRTKKYSTNSRNSGLQVLKENWKNLKYLQISQILCPEYFGIEYFGELLASCNNLEELDPPIIAISSPEYLSFNYKLYFENYILKPIIKFVGDRGRDYLNFSNKKSFRKLHLKEYLLSGTNGPGLLFQLAEECLKYDTVLFTETFVPFSKSMFLQLPEEGRYLFKSLGSLSGINDTLMSLEILNRLQFLSISFRSFFISEQVLDLCDIPIMPHLKEVEVEMTNDPPWDGRPYKLSSFMHKFCLTKRGEVERLKLVEVSRVNDTTMIRAIDIAKAFPNLTKLEITNWDAGKNEFETLWKGLQRLQEIHFTFCHNLHDDAFIGSDLKSPPILQLKYLRVLCLTEVGLITNLSFIHVFRHLRLKKFYHYTASGSMVTRVGYNALAKGVFRDSIQEMVIQCSSQFQQMDHFCDFLLQFPKLKRPTFEQLKEQPSSKRSVCENFSIDSSATYNQSCCKIQ